tara:strand:- start:1627 stop:1854 length:228 start_codon:yes stop_codon:yes gene_type:complete
MKITNLDLDEKVESINRYAGYGEPIIAVHWSHEGYQIHECRTGYAICPHGAMEEIYRQLVAMRYGMSAMGMGMRR